MTSLNMEKLRVGTDIVDMKRFKNAVKNNNFLKKVFTEREIDECNKKQNKLESLAARFCAKEAVKKTIDENIDFNIIEILSKDNSRPRAKILDNNLDKKYKLLISISHTKLMANAVCLTYKK